MVQKRGKRKKAVKKRRAGPARKGKRGFARSRKKPVRALVHPKDLIEEHLHPAPSAGYYSNDVHVAYFSKGDMIPASYKKIKLDLSKKVSKAEWAD